MAVPKRRTSKAKKSSRKSANMKMKAPGLSICPQCHEPKLPHRVCPNCNYYDGKEVVAIPKIEDALQYVLDNAEKDEVIIAAGSLYMIGHIRSIVK